MCHTQSDFQFSKLYGFRLEPHNIIKVRRKASLMPMHAGSSPCLGTRLVKGHYWCIFAIAVSNEYSLCPNILMFFITVMHLGAIACGVHKYDLYCYHLQGSCRHAARCTYVHSWDEWICPICTKDDKCDMKWEHKLQYIWKHIGLRMDKLC